METTWKFTKFTKILDCGKTTPNKPFSLRLFEVQGGWSPPGFAHPKTYITSKQIRIKVLKSKLKQEINKTKRYGLASL